MKKEVAAVLTAAGITVGSLIGINGTDAGGPRTTCYEDEVGFTQWADTHHETFYCIAIDDFLEEYKGQHPGVPAAVYMDYLDMLITNEYGIWTEGQKEFVYNVLANLLVDQNR